ncbi:MAG: hypothetical protein WCR86_11515 [Parabacteroides sp.]
MVELYKLPGTLTNLVDAISWAELNAQSGTINIYVDQAIAAGGTLTSTAISTASYHSGYMTVANTGASTNLAVLIESSVTEDGAVKTPLMSSALNATTKPADGNPIAILPNYIFITAQNLDTGNATTLSVTLTL